MNIVAAYFIGLLFGIGIAVSGMANPAKVLNFFDVVGSWDPSLMFVMGGALVTTMVGFRFILPKGKPLLDTQFRLPTATGLDGRLLGGSALFGMGWGIAGFCPGGALPALGTGIAAVFLFVISVAAGMLAAKAIDKYTVKKGPLTAAQRSYSWE